MRRSDVVFFLTGAAALVYETIWARLLARVLGHQAGATAVVLAVFMAGLGLGAALLAGAARRSRRPERLFGLLEGFVGLWAALSPWILGFLDPVDGLAARAVVSGLILLPPTVCMGATFPLMGRLTIGERSAAGRETSGFYGANTLGACAGALLGTGLLMPLLGLHKGLWAAAALSWIAAAIATTLRGPEQERPASEERRAPLESFLAVPFCFGLSSLALEVILTRLLVTVTGASVHAFAIVLAVFLLGIGLGSRHAAATLRDAARAPRALFLCAFAVPVLSLAGAAALRWQIGESDLFASLGNRIPVGVDPLRLWLSHALIAGFALFPPAFAFGVALPACAAVAAERQKGLALERVLGRVYAANTLGALAGSLLAAFVLMPALGLRWAYALALVPCLAAAPLVLRARVGPLAASLALAGALGVLVLRPLARADGARVLMHAAGVYEMVAVEESTGEDGLAVRSMRLNGKVEASTAPVDVRLQRLLGHVPGLLHGSPRRALCIGTGTGMTCGSLFDLPTIESVDLFEIERRVPEGTRLFGAWNNGLMDDPRLRIRFGDGRHSLMRSSESWDLITADPLHVWSKGSSDLYTLEYYRAMAARLAPGGVASQWIGLYELSTLDVQTVLATWCGAFAHARAYLTAYDLALVGSNDPLGRDLAAIELPERVRAALAPLGVHSGAEIEALNVGGDADLRAFCAGVPPMVDERPILEFRAPLSFRLGYSTEVLRWCAREDHVDRLPAASRKRAREVRALLRRFLDDLPAGMSAAVARYGADLLALPPSR